MGILGVGTLMLAACVKPTPATDGFWTFKSGTFNANSYENSYSDVTISDQATPYSVNYGTLVCNFYLGLPTSNGTYTYVVVGGTHLDSTNQVTLALTNTGTSDTLYHTTGGNGTETVQVTVSNGNLKINGSNIEMFNTSNPSDSAPINFSMVQP